jgi:hypothetical protein
MAFDEALAERIRHLRARRKNIEETKMFGGVGFLLNRNLLVGVWKDSLCVRDPPDGFVVRLKSGQRRPAQRVVLGVGVRPENKLAAEAGLEAGPRGGIKVNEHLQTSDPDIHAVGDAIEIKEFVTGDPAQVALAGPANRQGRINAGGGHLAGIDAVRHLFPQPGIMPTEKSSVSRSMRNPARAAPKPHLAGISSEAPKTATAPDDLPEVLAEGGQNLITLVRNCSLCRLGSSWPSVAQVQFHPLEASTPRVSSYPCD